MTPLQALKNRIVAVVPEIMELKFGCEVVWNKVVMRITSPQDAPLYTLLGWHEKVHKDKFSAILGCPITLAHILRAAGDRISIVGNGCICLWNQRTSRFQNFDNINWDLTKDLDGQTPRVIAFLLEIIPEK